MNTTQTCNGTTGKKAEGHYGRRICDTCGNSVLPKANGELRKHKAIAYPYPVTLIED